MTGGIQIGPVTAESGEKKFGYLPIIERAMSTVQIPVGIINGRSPGPCVVVTAGIHGSEYPGIEAATRIWNQLQPEQTTGAVVLFPVVNVPGFEAAEPNVNPLDNLNLNRIFPGDPQGSPSMILANRLVEEVARIADCVIDLHGGDMTEWLQPAFAIYFASGNEDVDKRSARLAHLFDTDYIWTTNGKHGYSGTFSAELARRGIPCVTSEAGFLGTYREKEIDHHVRGVRNILMDLGVLIGEPEITRQKEPTIFEENFTVIATHGGVMHPRIVPGEWVQKGQLLAEIKSIEGTVIEALHAPTDGFVRVLFPKRVVSSGSMVYRGWVSERT